MVLIEVGSSA